MGTDEVKVQSDCSRCYFLQSSKSSPQFKRDPLCTVTVGEDYAIVHSLNS